MTRREIIDRLTDDMADTLLQWALRDMDSLRIYAANAEGFEGMTDGELAERYYNSFDTTPEPTCQRCGSMLVDDRCADETCPYSDRLQNEVFTEG